MTDDPGSHGAPEDDPFWQFLAQFGIKPDPNQPMDLASIMRQVQQQLGTPAGAQMGFRLPPMIDPTSKASWNQLKDLARQVSATLGPDPTPTPDMHRRLSEASRLAELWLDDACDFAQLASPATVWSNAEWIENTMAAWQQIVEPIMSSMAEAMGGLLDEEQVQEESNVLAQLASTLKPMMRQMAGTMYGSQFAQALAQLARESLSGSDVGFQVLPAPRVAMLMSNIETHFADLDGVSPQDLLIHLTLRETARQRLFQQVAWLAPQMLAMIEHYAREIRIDTAAIESMINVDELTDLDPSRLTAMAEELQGKLFEPTRTDEQREVLGRLETLVALVEGWVDEVVGQAARRWMPDHAALTELIRRRRGVGGPMENVLNALVGLELRPRRVRDAANLWAALTAQRGQAARDGLWHHPDLLPSAADLDDPMGFVADQGTPSQTDDLDAELAALLEAEGGGDR